MKQNIIKWLKVLGLLVLGEILMQGGGILGQFIVLPLLASENAALQFAGMYGQFIGTWILTFAICLIFKKNRKYFPVLGKGGQGNNAKTILALGLPCGIGLNLLVGLVAAARGDIHLYFAEANIPLILLFIVTVAIQCGAEELIYRWFVYQKVKDLFPKSPLIPMIVTAVGFSAGHLMNPNVTVLSLTNIVFVGILYGLFITYYDCFWACVLAHTGWNFCQSIILGLPNSGVVSAYSIYRLDAATAVNSFCYDTGFGIEGTVMSTALIAVACVVVVILGKKKKAAASQPAAE